MLLAVVGGSPLVPTRSVAATTWAIEPEVRPDEHSVELRSTVAEASEEGRALNASHAS